jgi:hypothetical protein
MNPEQQQIAIAKAHGRVQRPDGSWFPIGKDYGSAGIPNYPFDLNAMHEAVSIFDYDQADQFEDHLCDICKRSNDEKENPAPWRFAVVNATASQRAEAFLRTIGKWEESR